MEGTNDSTSSRDDSLSHKILQLTARMFQQHADLLENQAAILNRMASRPDSPTSWAIEEPFPEFSQKKLVKEKTEALVIKSYEGMLQIQNRVDYLQNQMRLNGITEVRQYLSEDKKRKRSKGKTLCKTPFDWYREAYGPTVAAEFGVESHLEYNVQFHLMKQWDAMTPEDRLTYEEMAKQEQSRINEHKNPIQGKPESPSKELSNLIVDIEDNFENELEQESDQRNIQKTLIEGTKRVKHSKKGVKH